MWWPLNVPLPSLKSHKVSQLIRGHFFCCLKLCLHFRLSPGFPESPQPVPQPAGILRQTKALLTDDFVLWTSQ